MNAGEKGDELAEYVWVDIAECQDSVGRRIMAGRVVRKLIEHDVYTPPKPVAAPKPSPMSDVEE
jgi:hypothetical protein